MDGETCATGGWRYRREAGRMILPGLIEADPPPFEGTETVSSDTWTIRQPKWEYRLFGDNLLVIYLDELPTVWRRWLCKLLLGAKWKRL